MIETARAAWNEMEYNTVDAGGRRFEGCRPCQLTFTETPTQDIERFHDALDDRGYRPFSADPSGRGTKHPSYENEILARDDLKRVRILVMRGEVIRIYPRKDEPTIQELADILEAIETGFDAPLEHYPISNSGENT